MSKFTNITGDESNFWDKYCISTRTDNPIPGEKKHGLSSGKAMLILHDGSVRGHPITDKQRKFFGAISSGESPKE